MQLLKKPELKRKIKVVIDTNVLVSALINTRGTVSALLDRFIAGEFEAVISNDIFQEYEDVFYRKDFNFSSEKIVVLLKFLEKFILPLPISYHINICQDFEDNKFLECAMEGAVDFIVTGNKKRFPISEYKGIKIVSPAEFLIYFQK